MQPSHVGHRLDALADDAARVKFCLRKAAECRNAYFDGQNSEIARLVNLRTKPDRRRWGHYSRAAREEIARVRWRTSTSAKLLLSDEQMYSRWAGHFAAGASV